MRSLLCFLVVCLQAAEGLQEQDYIFSFLYNYGSSNYGLELYIASTSTNRQTVGNIFLPRSDVTIPFNIEPMSGELIQLPWAAQPSRSSYQSSTVYVQADQHIYIYGFSSDYGSSESFYPLPVTLLGTEYYVVTPSGVYSNYYPTFSVTSIYDDTRVLIFFNQQYGDYNSTHPMEVILNSLSTYVRQLSFDFTGTRITASKVVSVSSGHECANYDSSCDHIIEVMPPVESWGRTFAMTSFTGRTQGYFVKIFTTHADTIVRMVLQHEVYEVPGNGTLYFDMPLSSAVVMECDHPVMVVAQVKTNPFMSVIPAIEQSIVGPIPFYSFSDDDNYLNLWASTNDFRGILIDDEQVSWEVVMSSDSWGSLVRGSLSAGHHVVRHTDVNVTLSGIIYGYDYESSYAHTLPYKPAVNVKDTTAPYISICHTVPVEVIGNYDRNVTAVMWMEPSVIDEEGLPITVSTNYQPGDLFPIGSTTVMYSFSDYSGNRAFCSFDVIVHDITPPVPRCPGHLRVDSCSKKATISWPEPHVWDNSEGNVIITKDHEFGDELRGVEFIQYTFTDESGNVATCKIKVEVSKDDSLCWQLTMPFVISAVMLGLTLVPFLYTTGILVHHRRSTKSLVHRPGNENVGTTPPCQPPCGDDDIYEDPSQFQKGDGQKNDSGLTYEEPTTSPFGEDYVEAKPTSKGNDSGVNYEEPVASNDKDFAAEYEQPMASNDKDFDVAYEQPMAKHAQEILEGHFNKGNTIALS